MHSDKMGAMRQLKIQEEEDAVVCAFGPEFFQGARDGAAGGCVFTSFLCLSSYWKMKKDQMLVNFELGLKRGEPHPRYSSWVLVRGIHSQPMLAVGCIALGMTSFLKTIKFSLAQQRCFEFWQDDQEFTHLDLSEQRSLVEAYRRSEHKPQPPPVASTSSSSGRTKTQITDSKPLVTNSLLRLRNPGSTASLKTPTYYDGIAVGLLGTIFDCYLPQKPVYRYYNMHFGF